MVNFPEHNRISTVGGMNIEMVNILTGRVIHNYSRTYLIEFPNTNYGRFRKMINKVV